MNKQSLVEELPMCFKIQGQPEPTEKHKNKLTEIRTMECFMDILTVKATHGQTLGKRFLEIRCSSESRGKGNDIPGWGNNKAEEGKTCLLKRNIQMERSVCVTDI